MRSGRWRLGSAVPPSAEDAAVSGGVQQALERIHGAVCRRLARLPAGPASPVGINPRGHSQQPFDLSADAAVFEELQACFPGGLLLSEESGLRRFGETSPRWRFIVDPVDGSDNHARGLPLSAVSVAVLEAEGPLALGRVHWALVGDLEGNARLIAGRGLGCRRGEAAVSVSQVRVLRDAFVSCELNHSAPSRRLARLLSRTRAVRSYGCASQALALVARGALDAHLDVRGRLTAESFLAGAFLVEQAGGCVLDLDGRGFEQLTDLHSTVRVVAAATADLAHQIADELDE